MGFVIKNKLSTVSSNKQAVSDSLSCRVLKYVARCAAERPPRGTVKNFHNNHLTNLDVK